MATGHTSESPVVPTRIMLKTTFWLNINVSKFVFCQMCQIPEFLLDISCVFLHCNKSKTVIVTNIECLSVALHLAILFPEIKLAFMLIWAVEQK